MFNTAFVKVPSINVNIFTSVQTIHFLGGWRVCENQHFFPTLLTFWHDFYYFHGDFWHSKNVDVYLFLGRWEDRVSESVWFVHSWKCWHLWTATKFNCSCILLRIYIHVVYNLLSMFGYYTPYECTCHAHRPRFRFYLHFVSSCISLFIKIQENYFIIFPTLDAFLSSITESIDLIFAPLSISATYNVSEFVLPLVKNVKICSKLFDVL